MGGKHSTSTSKVSVPPEVLARYNAINTRAEGVAATPFERYGNQASDFVAQMNAQQNAGISDINATAGSYRPYMSAATDATTAGMGPAYQGIDNYMSPYIKNVADTTGAMMRQQFEQAQSGNLGNAISSGAFGGDRAGIAAANLQQQNEMGYGKTMADIYNQGYTQALGASQADLARQMQGGSQLAALGAQEQQLGLQGAQAKIAAGTMQQQTEQAGKDAMIKQFMQEKGYPFQVAQFLANIAMGTGAASGSTTTATQPIGFFGNLATGGRVGGYADGGGVAGPKIDSQSPLWGEGYVPSADLPVGRLMTADIPDHQQSSGLGDIVKLIAASQGAKRGGVIDGRHGYAEGGGSAAMTPEEMELFRRRQAIMRDPSIDMPNTGTDNYQPHGNVQQLTLGSEAPPVQINPNAGITGYGNVRGGSRAEAALPTTPQTTGESISKFLHPIRANVGAGATNTAGMLSGGIWGGSSVVPTLAGVGLSALGGQDYGGNYLLDVGKSMRGVAGDIYENSAKQATEIENAPWNSSVTSLPAQPTGGVAPTVRPAEPQGLTLGASASGALATPTSATGVMPIGAQQTLPSRAGLAPPARPAIETAPAGVVGGNINAPTVPASIDSHTLFTQGIVPIESGGQQFKNGHPLTSPKGAVGISQMLPSTGPEAAKLAGLEWDEQKFYNDPAYNAALGEAYFSDLNRRYGDPVMAAAAYNGGQGNLASAIDRAAALGGSYLDYMPAETQAYAKNFAARTGNLAPDLQGKTGGVSGANTNGMPSAAQQPSGGLGGADLLHVNKPYEDRNAIGKFFHDKETGKLDKNAVLSLLSGLGTMASSRSISPITAMLQGLGGGAEMYKGLQKQAADIAQTQADTRQRDVQTNALRFFKPEGGVAMVTLPNGQTVKYWDLMRDPSLQGGISPAALADVKAQAAASGEATPDAAPANSIFNDPTGRAIIGNEASYVEGPGYDTAIARSMDIRTQVNADATAARGMHDSTVEQIRAVSDMLAQPGATAPGAAGSAKAQVVKYGNSLLSAMGFPADTLGNMDSDVDLLTKIRNAAASAAAHGADQNSVQALQMLADGMPNENITEDANAAIMSNILVQQQRAMDKDRLYADFSQSNPYGTVYGAADMFARMNGKYDLERDALQKLVRVGGVKGTDGVSIMERLTSGTLSPQEAQSLISMALGGKSPTEDMYRYFIPYQARG